MKIMETKHSILVGLIERRGQSCIIYFKKEKKVKHIKRIYAIIRWY